MTVHLEWATLNDYADGRLDPAARQAAAAHLDACGECRGLLAELRCLLAAASDVPGAIDPPAGLWADVRSTLDARRRAAVPPDAKARLSSLVATPSSGSRTTVTPRVATPGVSSPRPARRWLAAAAIVLMAASSAITAVVMRRDDGGVVAARIPEAVPNRGTLPVSFATAERGYLASVEELQSLLDAERDRLAPATLATVERSLATIDDAIGEARAALLADPANRELADLLASSYRHKVDLLRRATELEARS